MNASPNLFRIQQFFDPHNFFKFDIGIFLTIKFNQMDKKSITTAIFLILITNVIFGQSGWQEKAPFGGDKRAGSFSFSIGLKGYVGGGQTLQGVQADFWEYDFLNDVWIRKADFPGGPIWYSQCFTIGDKAYLTGGSNPLTGIHNSQLWQYNPESDTWILKSDFPAGGRLSGVAFAIGNCGYIGTGYDSQLIYHNDLWEYNSITDEWLEKASFGEPRGGGVGFSINGKGYIGLGSINNFETNDFWEYNPLINMWTEVNSFPGVGRNTAVGLVADSKGYIITGSNDEAMMPVDFWEFDPITKGWVQRVDFPGPARGSAVGFSIEDSFFITTGSAIISSELYKDCWEYSPSSRIIVSNKIYNPTLSEPKILIDQYTYEPLIPLKICADGSASTYIQFINKTVIPDSDIRLTIGSDPEELNKELYGYISDYRVEDGTINVTLHHPQYLPSQYKPFRSDYIDIVSINDPENPLFKIPLNIYRAPLLTVHGLWGGSSTFQNLKDDFVYQQFYPDNLIHITDYWPTNSESFETNKSVVSTAITSCLSRVRDGCFSAGKVDIVAHSMGGILSRIYLQSEYYNKRSDIHKLITLNTPHSGSHGANLLMNKNEPEALVANLAVSLFLKKNDDYTAGKIDDGAVQDLAVNSQALYALNNTNLNNNIVPTHTITSEADFAIGDSWVKVMFIAMEPYISVGINSFLYNLFNHDQNDLVVSILSQSGGLSYLHTTHFYNQMHLGAARNIHYKSEIINAININPNNQTYFCSSGFQPFTLSSDYKSISSINEDCELVDESVQITSPLVGQSFTTGEVVAINFTSEVEINRVIFFGFSEFSLYTIDTVMNSGVLYYTIPMDAIERASVIMMGFDNHGCIRGFDTLTININSTSVLESLSFANQDIRLQVTEIANIPLFVNYNSGYSYTPNNITGIQFSIADTTIASLLYNNKIKGVKEGITRLIAQFQDITDTISIYVLKKDSLMEPPNSYIPIEYKRNVDQLIIYPNPTKGEFKIMSKTGIRDKLEVNIYNQTGKIVKKLKLDSLNDEIDLTQLPRGVYFLQVLNELNVYRGKVIKL